MVTLQRATGSPLWRRTALRADAWRSELRFNECVVRQIPYGVLGMPTVPFVDSTVLSELLQTEEDRRFALEDLERRCHEEFYKEVRSDEAHALARAGMMISPAFKVWEGHGRERRGRFVVHFKRQRKHWPKGSVKMETLQSFASQLQERDMLTSWYIKSGYRHFYLHPGMRKFFLFRYDGRFDGCIALPFGWGRSMLSFTKLLLPLVLYIRERLRYRILPYIDDFACAPSPLGRSSTRKDCACAEGRL